ncbi:MAG: hypothetical protein JO016_05965 [Actinobacteria bacterium]|nr:hypothetical protein [Actinomycetota bacterium]
MTCVVVLLGVGVYFAWSAYQHTSSLLISAGCQAGSGTNAVSLDPQQASIAATIAGVAAAERLPAHAVTIAYATAMQESKMHNLDYGDRDSVGVFQQRPSEGWGTASQLKDPVYATAAFFGALTKVHGWQELPVDQAAQDVQHSADGSAYSQYDLMARAMAIAFTGQAEHAVYCWPGPGPAPARNLTAARSALAEAFGTAETGHPVTGIVTSGTAKAPAVAVRVEPQQAWAVASWLVTHAQAYGISDVRYNGYQWTEPNASRGWQPATGSASTTSGSILLH